MAGGDSSRVSTDFALGGAVELKPGTPVGEYRIERLLGHGAMGAVFSAIHPVIGKRAAVKVIGLELCREREAIERFVLEARAVSQIQHTNIVDIFSFGTLADGRSYFIMELLDGESLGDRLCRGRVLLPDAVEMLTQICRALEATHAQGIVHRDLKPDNVFLKARPDEPPLVKLLDFGLAKLASPQGGMQAARLTQTGMTLGTPHYMAPEQVLSSSVDGRADIYSLGVMTYQMLLGKLPFPDGNVSDILAKHLDKPPPPPRDLWPDIPAPIEQLLLQMLHKNPKVRPTLPDVRARLQPYHSGIVPTGWSSQLVTTAGAGVLDASQKIAQRNHELARQTDRVALPPTTSGWVPGVIGLMFVALLGGAGVWYHVHQESAEAAAARSLPPPWAYHVPEDDVPAVEGKLLTIPEPETERATRKRSAHKERERERERESAKEREAKDGKDAKEASGSSEKPHIQSVSYESLGLSLKYGGTVEGSHDQLDHSELSVDKDRGKGMLANPRQSKVGRQLKSAHD